MEPKIPHALISAKEDVVREIEAIMELFQADDENIDLRTDLSREEINAILRLMFVDYILEKEFGIDLPLSEYVAVKFMRLKVSENRKSRKEFVKAIVGLKAKVEESKSIFQKLFSRKKEEAET